MTVSRAMIPGVCALAILIVPFTGLLPEYWITLFNYIGISSLVAIGLVLLTGVGGMTSFGQSAFVGFGAYTTGVLTVYFGISPWLTLPAALIVAAAPTCQKMFFDCAPPARIMDCGAAAPGPPTLSVVAI